MRMSSKKTNTHFLNTGANVSFMALKSVIGVPDNPNG
jgi:hypothetical protein